MKHGAMCALVVAASLIGAAMLGPQPVLAQGGQPATVLTSTVPISGGIQISADNPLAIRALLEGEAAIPGGYASYGLATAWGLIFGGLGGLVFELLRLRGLLPLPYVYPAGQMPSTDLYSADGYIRPKRVVDLGFLARVFVGAMAALAVLLVVAPPQRMQFIAATILAGSAGASIFDLLRARLTASLAVADAADLRLKGEDLKQRLEQIEQLVTQLQQQNRPPAPAALEAMRDTADTADSTHGTNGAQLPAMQMLVQTSQANADLLDQISRALGEAKGISSAMERPRVVE